MSKAARALIIDDEADIRELIALSLDRIGLDTHTAANLGEARSLLDNYQFDVCLTDMRLPDGNGVEFVEYLQRVRPALPVAVITAHGNMDAAVEAMKNGAFDFVSKPVDIQLLRQLVLQAVSVNHPISQQAKTPENNGLSPPLPRTVPTDHALRSEPVRAAETRSALDFPVHPDRDQHMRGGEKLIGQSAPMQALRTMIGKVARTNAPVWITGESGTGKELIAKLIHQNGSRASGPFIAVNCGAIPSELMESEMFGHRKGSFTGAQADHHGLFKRADQGTLFLDEVAELPLPMQVKLLRAIQERSIRPVGATQEISTDVRILSASHKDLNDEVNQGRFRHDLYYRLNVICVKAPALRDRASDIPLIAQHILKRISASEDRLHTSELSEEARTLLKTYHYPGNVRELENILERAVAMTEGPLIDASDLAMDSGYGFEQSVPHTLPGRDDELSEPDERALIERTLHQTHWNRKEAAIQLGMTYRQLRYRIQQYGIGAR